MQLLFKLNDADCLTRMEFCTRFLNLIDHDANIIGNLWMSDEAHFYLEGFVNKQNMRIWGTKIPRENFRQKPFHPVYVTVWAAISKLGIIGPYFFEDAHGSHISVMAARYHHMLQTFFYPTLPNFPGVQMQNQWFQQDGSTSHTALLPRNWLLEKFPGRLISKFSPFNWPARSPDLSVLDFYLWGALKDCVFSIPVETTQQLKHRITTEMNKINLQIIDKAFDNFVKRLHECLDNNGSHVRNTFHHAAPVVHIH